MKAHECSGKKSQDTNINKENNRTQINISCQRKYGRTNQTAEYSSLLKTTYYDLLHIRSYKYNSEYLWVSIAKKIYSNRPEYSFRLPMNSKEVGELRNYENNLSSKFNEKENNYFITF